MYKTKLLRHFLIFLTIFALMKPLLVIFHLFYPDQLNWFLGKLSNINGCQWDLIVTGPPKSKEAKEAILSLKPNTVFHDTDNVGYDIWPFFSALKTIDIEDYSCIVKLHTKKPNFNRTIHLGGLRLRGYKWRDVMVNAFLKDSGRFSKAMKIMEDNPKVGMICSRELYTGLDFQEDKEALDLEMERIGLNTPERRFCVGTIMLLRAEVLSSFPLSKISASMFPLESESDSGGTIAHVYERILSLLAPACGYSVCTLSSVPGYELRMKIRGMVKPVSTFIFNIDREGPERVKYLTVFGMKIKLGR